MSRFSPCRVFVYPGTAGEAAGEYLRGRYLLVAPPLRLTSLVTFLFSDKKVTFPY